MAEIGYGLLGTLQNTVMEMVGQVGRTALNTIYPKEFEVYMVSLELTDANDNLIDFFTFPVNPESISKSQPQTKMIDRTSGAIVVNKTGMFVPQDLVIKGNFGRTFKFVTRDSDVVSFAAHLIKGLIPNKTEFNHYYKTGYGCFKVLQDICEQSDILDNGKARRLYFHNYALGESYLVEVINFQASQSLGQNMMWGYDLRLKILSNVNSTDNLVSLLAKATAMTAITSAMSSVVRVANTIISNI